MQANPTELTLERLPSGEFGWLRLNPHTVRIIEDGYAPLPDDARFTITDIGRRALRMAELFAISGARS